MLINTKASPIESVSSTSMIDAHKYFTKDEITVLYLLGVHLCYEPDKQIAKTPRVPWSSLPDHLK